MQGNPYDDASDPRAATIERWQADGWTGEMQVEPHGNVWCPSCDQVHAATSWAVEHVGRTEGISNPDDEELFVALTCPACGARGTMTLGYGATSSGRDADVAAALPDARSS